MGNEGDKNYSDISIWVDRYEDLFSDYDSRDFTERALSDDFIMEVRKLVREMPSDNIELKFNLMADQRNPDTEAIIINHIHEYFTYYAKVVKKEMDLVQRNGILLSIAGFALIIALIVFGHYVGETTLLSQFHVAVEPVGWFLCWTGLDMIFAQSKKEQTTIDFNLKMARAQLTFASFGMVAEVANGEETQGATKVIPCGNNLRIAS